MPSTNPFQDDHYLYGLPIILPLVAFLLFYAHRKRVAAALQFANPTMVDRLMPPLSGPRPWIKGILILAGLGLLIMAVARPRFGVDFEQVSQRGVDLFVALDVSRSMAAEDVTPSRLGRAKFEIQDLLTHLVGDRVGLLVFAGKPVVRVPLTTDHGFFRMVLDETDIGSAPRGGTLIGDAIRKAMVAMPEQRDRDQVIVLITDGEDHDSYPKEAAQQAADAGIKIFTVALGDSNEGARIPIRENRQGLRYLRDQGQEVWSKVNERLLKEIALGTDGAYIPSGALADGLGQIYESHLAGLAQGEIHEEKRKRYREQFQLFVCFGMALLLIEMAIPSYRRPVKEEGVQTQTPAASIAAVALFCIAVLPQTAWAGSPDVAATVVRGIRHYKSGDYKTALSAFRDADVARPDDPWILFDLATSYAASGDVDKADDLFRQAALTQDQDLAARCHYNLGTLAAAQARTAFGENPEQAALEVRERGLSLLAEAVAHYRDCLELEKNHTDARHNLEVIRLWMKHMQALWEEQDRQKTREEMNLLGFLAMLEANQRGLRGAARSISNEPDSPRRRQTLSASASEQRRLQEEIEPLKQKIAESLQPQTPPGGSASSPPLSDDKMQEAIELFNRLADEARETMLAAADNLDAGSIGDAIQDQEEVLENLDQIYLGVVPFPTLLQRATSNQQQLIDQVAPAVSLPDETEEDGQAGDESALDQKEVAWNQEFVTGWAQIMGPKAAQSLKQLDEMGDAALGGGADPTNPQQPGADPEAAKEALEGLKQSMQKAVELGPKVETLSSEAADALREEKPNEALPKQEEALKLLQEIAESLPKQDQQEQGDQQQNQDDQHSQAENKQSGQDPQQQQQPERRRQDLSRQQAEAVMRKVRERQKERRDLEKQLQQQMVRPGEVDKDW